jgi:hypothetical protein
MFICFQQHVAASKGHEDITHFLIERGADVKMSGDLLTIKLDLLKPFKWIIYVLTKLPINVE